MHPTVADRYLSLLKRSLLNELYIENEARIVYYGLCAHMRLIPDTATVRDIAARRPDILARLRNAREQAEIVCLWQLKSPEGKLETVNLRSTTEVYHSMIGRRRMNNIHELLDRVVGERVPGDLIETGVWRGGATIFMRGYLAAHGIVDRKVWVADSFAGLPKPTAPQDEGYDFSAEKFPGLAISRAEVEDLFNRYELLDGQVAFLEGWFKDTLPAAPIGKLALMRLDGDLYESTMDALNALYARLSPGGFVIVDDYGDFEPCQRAVDEFRQRHGIASPIQQIDWTGVYWRKE